MKAFGTAVLLAFSAANLPAQVPGPAAQSQNPPEPVRAESKPSSTFIGGFLKTDFGFSSTYPTDWQDLTATLPSQMTRQLKKMEAEKDPFYVLARRQLECRQPVLLLQHGNPPSLISVIAFPHSCTKVSKSDEAAFIFAAAMGSCSVSPSSKYDVTDTLQGAYKLGNAIFVIERAVGSSKNHPEVKVTLERVCGLLNTSKVFWEGELRDKDAVKAFESAMTSIDGAAPSPLVPPSAIAKLHRPYAAPSPLNLPPKKSTAPAQ